MSSRNMVVMHHIACHVTNVCWRKCTDLLLLELSSALLTSLLLGLALLEESLWDEDLLLGRDGAIISD